MTSLYDAETISAFILDEKLAIHGVSPEVYAQNLLIIKELGIAATAASEDLLAVQIIGSRGNGTSGLESDLDLVVVTFDTDKAQKDNSLFREVIEGLSVPIDTDLAAMANGAQDTIPTDGSDFVYWIDTEIHQASSLFENGVYASPNLRLAQLAVTSMLASYASESDAQDKWGSIRRNHADIYLGNLNRMRKKLTERLGIEQEEEILKLISKDLMNQRRREFAIPKNLKSYHTKLENWAKKNKSKIQTLSGWELYQDVLSEL